MCVFRGGLKFRSLVSGGSFVQTVRPLDSRRRATTITRSDHQDTRIMLLLFGEDENIPNSDTSLLLLVLVKLCHSLIVQSSNQTSYHQPYRDGNQFVTYATKSIDHGIDQLNQNHQASTEAANWPNRQPTQEQKQYPHAHDWQNYSSKNSNSNTSTTATT